MNGEKIILDLCGGTGAWSAPYKENGYDVRVVTLPEYDVISRTSLDESTGCVVFYKDGGVEERILAKNVYGILAAPTCTMFSLARTTAKTPRDLHGAMGLVSKCLEIVWFCREQEGSKLKFWALENPVGLLRQFLGKPYLTFDPCDYGDTYTKKTDLWGYFNEPRKNKRELTEEEKERCKINKRILPSLPEGYVVPDGWNTQAARRSMTSKCFAYAFYRANK